ncbi:T cell receptor alpha chain MC.7.G5-like isoform X2 [Lagenorhynchus albirostris]|uniref:T cell receptor alpha chain MC.7.G5-like isoform X2 n=1 Tax=Lagenorhynchus albirostris TaxID=27610 RepID=UPI0028E80DEC|nr:T cell receptor alpha chain MC.7.G5-like isoform X2 [Lagenorhynchus albirostris]
MLLSSLLKVVMASLWLGSSIAQKVTQDQPVILVQEKEVVTLDCIYDTNEFTYSLYWYKQPSSGAMILLIRQDSYNQQNATEGRYSLNFQKANKSIKLAISASQLEDSAVYFCALRDYTGVGGYQLIFGKGTKLLVIPNIQNPDPAVYLLRSPKSSNTSVCLYTDFESQANVSQVTRPVVFSSDSTVLDMGALGSKSNGVVAWSSRTDLGCGDTFNQTFYSSSGIPCDAKIAEKSFETDMNLNFQNLSVIGFRVLLLKVVGYNLLMTLRLWSS